MSRLVGYDTSSESDSASSDEKSASGKPAHTAGSRPVGTLPGLIYLEIPTKLSESSAFCAAKDRYIDHFSRRLFSLMAVVDTSAARQASACGSVCFRPLPLPDQYVETPLHISLSRFFALTPERAEALVHTLRTEMGAEGSSSSRIGHFDVSLEGCQTFNASGASAVSVPDATGKSATSLQARVFLGPLLGRGREETIRLIRERIDVALAKHGVPAFYEPTEPHVSIAVGTQLLRPGAKCEACAAASAAAGSGSSTASTAVAAAGKGHDSDDDAAASGAPAAKRRRRDLCSVDAAAAATVDTRGSSPAACGGAGSDGAAAASDLRSRGEAAGETAAAVTRPHTARTSEVAACVDCAALSRPIGTGDYALSAADVGLDAMASPSFTAAEVCVKVGKRLWRIPL